jgi:hypothetical protein
MRIQNHFTSGGVFERVLEACEGDIESQEFIVAVSAKPQLGNDHINPARVLLALLLKLFRAFLVCARLWSSSMVFLLPSRSIAPARSPSKSVAFLTGPDSP